MEQTSPKYSGEPSVQSVASGLASLGRYGDTYMVHAAEGETVIPVEVLDKNPRMKQKIFKQIIKIFSLNVFSGVISAILLKAGSDAVE